MANIESLSREQLIDACGCMESALIAAILETEAEGLSDTAAKMRGWLKLAQEGRDSLAVAS